MKKRVLALVLCMIMVVCCFAACGGDNNNNNDNANGGDIIIAAAALGADLDPMSNTDGISSSFQYATYDRLVQYGTTTDANGNVIKDATKIEPMLATWKISDDKLTYTFSINKDAKFANGEDVTAEDVVWSLEYSRDNVDSAFVFGKTNIVEIKALDEHTVECKLSAHSNIIFQVLEMYTCAIIDKSQVDLTTLNEETHSYGWLKSNVAGSGPYEITHYDNSSKVVLTAREDYWGEAPKNNSITYLKVPEEANRQLMLEQGTVDVALDISEKNCESLDAKDGITVQTNSLPKFMYLTFNMNDEFFGNAKVREAIALALPYADIIDTAMFGRAGMFDSSCVPSVMDCLAKGTGYNKQDLAKAKQLIADAGYANGHKVQMLLGSGFQDWKDTAVIIQAALKELGITMEIKEVERAQFLSLIAEKNQPFFINRVLSYVNDPGYLLGMLMHSTGNFNYINYNSTEFDGLYAKAEATLDPAERADYYKQIQELVKADLPIIPIYEYSFNFSHSDAVSGYQFRTDGTIHFASLQKN